MPREATAVTTLDVQGIEIPKLGLGTWQLSGDDCVEAVRDAIELGYRHIDTARAYGNEAQVGQGLHDSGRNRDEIFLTTKLWYTELRAIGVHDQVEQSLRDLRTEYIDLLLIHWPNRRVPLRDVARCQAATPAGRLRARERARARARRSSTRRGLHRVERQPSRSSAPLGDRAARDPARPRPRSPSPRRGGRSTLVSRVSSRVLAGRAALDGVELEPGAARPVLRRTTSSTRSIRSASAIAVGTRQRPSTDRLRRWVPRIGAQRPSLRASVATRGRKGRVGAATSMRARERHGRAASRTGVHVLAPGGRGPRARSHRCRACVRRRRCSLHALSQRGGSDLHLKAGPPLMRVDGDASDRPAPRADPGRHRDAAGGAPAGDRQARGVRRRARGRLLLRRSTGIARFRVNAFRQRGAISPRLPRDPVRHPHDRRPHLPPVIRELAEEERGIILVTGTTGSGKSTTLAAMIDHMNERFAATSSRSRTRSSSCTATSARSSTSARSARTRTPSSARCAASCARTRTSSSSARCATRRRSTPR